MQAVQETLTKKKTLYIRIAGDVPSEVRGVSKDYTSFYSFMNPVRSDPMGQLDICQTFTTTIVLKQIVVRPQCSKLTQLSILPG